jgi:hypothetical protein
MTNIKCNLFVTLSLLAIAAASVSAQTKEAKNVLEKSPVTSVANTQTVDARQSGAWTVGIDPARSVVIVQNSAADPLSVSVVDPNGRQPFQMRVPIDVFAGGPSSSTETLIPIPVGKRFVIENVSAEAEIPAGEKIVLFIQTRLDASSPNNSTPHFIALSDQGVFGTKSIFAANHKTLEFAVIQLSVTARPTFSSGTGSATVTLSGYLENLPSAASPGA